MEYSLELKTLGMNVNSMRSHYLVELDGYSIGTQNHRQLRLRGYQEEIGAQAFTGKNDIIVLPTGTGKTYVAIEIIRRHLSRTGGLHYSLVRAICQPSGMIRASESLS